MDELDDVLDPLDRHLDDLAAGRTPAPDDLAPDFAEAVPR
jgi:hypothetical protein